MTGRDGDPEREQGWEAELLFSEAEFVADLSAVQADDALLDALGGSDPAIADGLGDEELNALLVAWRRDIDSEPLAELVDLDTAVRTVGTAALAAKHRGGRGRRRVLVPVAAAAAVLAIAFTGTGLAARDAQPGDTLWGLSKVLYADHARSVEAAATAQIDLERANLAIAGGNLDAARKALADAQNALTQVTDDENRDQLIEQHRQLAAQLDDPTSTVPGSSQATATSVPAKPTATPPGSATADPGGSTSLPGTSVTPPPTTPPPATSTTPTPPPPSSSTAASGSDPGTGGAPRQDVSGDPPNGSGG